MYDNFICFVWLRLEAQVCIKLLLFLVLVTKIQTLFEVRLMFIALITVYFYETKSMQKDM